MDHGTAAESIMKIVWREGYYVNRYADMILMLILAFVVKTPVAVSTVSKTFEPMN